MKIALSIFTLLFAGVAFAHEAPATDEHVATHAPFAKGTLTRGEKVPAGEAKPVEQVLAKPQDFDGKSLVVEGTVRRACSHRGCWMELAPADAKAAGIRVSFKGEAFFVPTDSAGAHARVLGMVKVAQLSAAEAKSHADQVTPLSVAADGSVRELELEATGVELKK